MSLKLCTELVKKIRTGGLSRWPMDKPTETSQEDDNTFVINNINIQNNEQVLNTVMLKFVNNWSDQSNDENIDWIKKVFNKEIDKSTINKSELNIEKLAFLKDIDNLFIHESNLWRKTSEDLVQFVVPNDARMKIMELNHESILSGHLKFDKTLDRIKDKFFWPKLRSDVQEFIERCIICQKTSDPKNKIRIPLNPLRPSYPLEIVTTDSLGPLKTSKNGFKYILVVIDHFPKWIVLYAIKNIDAKTTAKFLFEFICKFGIQTAFLSDQGKNYQAQLLQELWELLDIRPLRRSPFHPECDGLSERLNRTLKRMIKCFINDNHDNWDELLPALSFAYNTVTHSTTKFTPYELMLPIDLVYKTPKLNLKFDPYGYAEYIKNKFTKMYETVLMAAKFKEGVAVWPKNEQVKKGQCKKFIYNWKGPYIIVKNIRDVNYIIRPMNKKKRRLITINRSRLKKHFHIPENIEDMNESQVEQARKKLSHKKFDTTRSKRAKGIVERAKTLLNNRTITSSNELNEVVNKSSDDRINSENGLNGQITNFDQGSVQGNDHDDNTVESDDSQKEEKNDPTHKGKIIKEIFVPDRPDELIRFSMENEDRNRQRDVQQEEQEEETMEQIDEPIAPHCCNGKNLAFLDKFYKNYIEKQSNNIMIDWPLFQIETEYWKAYNWNFNNRRREPNESSDEQWF
ncbi:unnamed protein product [Brachionus calyciflorus]|uniref:Integrase catalytic domain-containing protein n=1 Tax=Brachionus calyciflorus TaxID=104777 RepID=A0A814G9Y1_9BILA|nr:unnamed protein product [Brachionus calyciflorus]